MSDENKWLEPTLEQSTEDTADYYTAQAYSAETAAEEDLPESDELQISLFAPEEPEAQPRPEESLEEVSPSPVSAEEPVEEFVEEPVAEGADAPVAAEESAEEPAEQPEEDPVEESVEEPVEESEEEPVSQEEDPFAVLFRTEENDGVSSEEVAEVPSVEAEPFSSTESLPAEEALIPGTEIIGRRARRAALEEEKALQQAAAKAKAKRVGSAVSPIVEFAEIIVGALVAAILVLTILCRTGVVSGTSMVPTMQHGDRYVISDLFYTPEQGDIVVFRPGIEGNDEEELWIKRVIAVEGQKVYIDPETYRVYVDGQLLSEPYLHGAGTIPHTTQNPIVVPEGCVYVLGDNRGISHDSRYADLGCVPVGQLAGRVILRFWPLNSFGPCE